MKPNKHNNENHFDSSNLLEDSKVPESPFKIKDLHFWNSIQNYEPSPWGLQSARNNLQKEAKGETKLNKRPYINKVNFNTLTIRSKVHNRPHKHIEEKPEEFKMNNTFLQFRVIATGRSSRNQKYQTPQSTIKQNTITAIPSRHMLEQKSKYIPQRWREEKSPKIKFLERKFKLKYSHFGNRGKSIDESRKDKVFNSSSEARSTEWARQNPTVFKPYSTRTQILEPQTSQEHRNYQKSRQMFLS